jgi:hypothetical protein
MGTTIHTSTAVTAPASPLDVLPDLYAGSGKIAPDVVAALVAAAPVKEASAAESAIVTAEDAIRAAQSSKRDAVKTLGEATVVMSRLAFLLTDKRKSITGSALAEAWGVAPARVSQLKAVGAAEFAALGAPTGKITSETVATIRALEKARKSAGAKGLTETVAAVKRNVKADGEPATARGVIDTARAVIEDADKSEPTAATYKALTRQVQNLADRVKGATGTDEERTHFLAAVQRLVNASK